MSKDTFWVYNLESIYNLEELYCRSIRNNWLTHEEFVDLMQPDEEEEKSREVDLNAKFNTMSLIVNEHCSTWLTMQGVPHQHCMAYCDMPKLPQEEKEWVVVGKQLKDRAQFRSTFSHMYPDVNQD